jgi:hypothetical protein
VAEMRAKYENMVASSGMSTMEKANQLFVQFKTRLTGSFKELETDFEQKSGLSPEKNKQLLVVYKKYFGEYVLVFNQKREALIKAFANIIKNKSGASLEVLMYDSEIMNALESIMPQLTEIQEKMESEENEIIGDK